MRYLTMSKTESKNSCICPFIWINPSNLHLKFVQNSMCNPSDEPTDPGEHMKSFAGVMIQSDVIQKMMRTIKILNCLTKKKPTTTVSLLSLFTVES